MANDRGRATRVTLQTIADHLGVSRTTVSNAYNRPDQLGDDLREHILETATDLGYRGPDAAGRMLRTGRMGAIGLLFTEDLRFVFTGGHLGHGDVRERLLGEQVERGGEDPLALAGPILGAKARHAASLREI